MRYCALIILNSKGGRAVHAEPLHLKSQQTLAFYQHTSGLQTAWFEHFQLDINEVPARDWRIALSYENKESPVWQLSVEQLELADVHSVLSRVWPLPQVGADVLNHATERHSGSFAAAMATRSRAG